MSFSDFLSLLNSEADIWSSIDFANWLEVDKAMDRPIAVSQLEPGRRTKLDFAATLLECGPDAGSESHLIVSRCVEPRVAQSTLGARFAELPDLVTERGTPVLLSARPHRGEAVPPDGISEALRAAICCQAFDSVHYWVIEMSSKTTHLYGLNWALQALEGSQAFGDFVAFIRGQEVAA